MRYYLHLCYCLDFKRNTQLTSALRQHNMHEDCVVYFYVRHENMNDNGKNWFDGLTQFVAECRVKRPVANRDDLSSEQEVQCRIIGGSLIAWLEKYGPDLLQERVFLARSPMADRFQNCQEDPFIVFTSEQPGLVAAREILEEGPATIAFLYPDEFSEWLIDHPDAEYNWHVHTWSFFTPVDADTAIKAEKYSIAPGESYWLHKEGTMCGHLFGRGGDHLWKWNGHEHVLLEECINEWVS